MLEISFSIDTPQEENVEISYQRPEIGEYHTPQDRITTIDQSSYDLTNDVRQLACNEFVSNKDFVHTSKFKAFI